MNKDKILDALVLNRFSVALIASIFAVFWVIPCGLYLYVKNKIKKLCDM